MRSSAPRLAAAALTVLAGCRSLPPALPPGESWEVRRPQLQSLEHFALRGRVAVAAADQGFNANLRWTQDGDRSQVTLEGPLGVGGAQLTAQGDELTVITARGERVENEAAHAELAAHLGFDPPLSSLRYWVLGVPDPREPASESLDHAQQRLSGLTQSGWHVENQSYALAGSEALPARMTMQRDAVRVRLLVDNWQR